MIKERKSKMSRNKNEVRSDAFAFCHGMLGFGEDELVNKVMPYFGGAAGSIAASKMMTKHSFFMFFLRSVVECPLISSPHVLFYQKYKPII